jgi:hypothetical protein
MFKGVVIIHAHRPGVLEQVYRRLIEVLKTSPEAGAIRYRAWCEAGSAERLFREFQQVDRRHRLIDLGLSLPGPE